MEKKLDLVKASSDIKEIINDLKEFQFEEEKRKINKQLKSFYQTFTKKILTEDEKIFLLSKLHIMREFTAWFIGEMLIKEEVKIKKEVLDWKNGKNIKPPKYKSIYEFILENEDILGFGKSTAYNYMNINKKAGLETFLKLGVRKTLLITSIKDEKLAKKVMKQAIQQKWTTEKMKDRIESYFEKEKQKKEKEVDVIRKTIDKEIMISSLINDKRINQNELLITFSNKDERDKFNEILLEVLPNIKKRIYSMYYDKKN